MSRKSDNLHRARRLKNDEFYTRYEDVKKECDNYLSHFFNKVIYCNCDTSQSAFVKYFQELKARGLIKDVWFSGGINGDDFRSQQSVERLKAADIVVTNPPFSLFREYVDLLVEHNKRFLIIGSINAVAYKNTFKLIQNNSVFTGCTFPRLFIQPNGDIKKFGNICWFTNISTIRFKNDLVLHKQYYGNESYYPKYDNADAININKITDIPTDYAGIMGVPITFITGHNLTQFEILGLDNDFTDTNTGVILNGHSVYRRVFIRNKYLSASNDDYKLKQVI